MQPGHADAQHYRGYRVRESDLVFDHGAWSVSAAITDRKVVKWGEGIVSSARKGTDSARFVQPGGAM
jgi:hypothetical protein